VRTHKRGWVKAHPGGFQGGGRHLDSSEATTLRGAVVEADLRPVRRNVEETPTTTKRRVGDPGAREMFEEGSSPHGESLSRALPTRAHPTRGESLARWAWHVGHRGTPWARSSERVWELDGVARRRESGVRVTWSGPRESEGVSGAAAQVHGRGSIARRVCLRVVGVAEVDGRRLAQRSATRISPKPIDRLRRRGLGLEGTARIAKSGTCKCSSAKMRREMARGGKAAGPRKARFEIRGRKRRSERGGGHSPMEGVPDRKRRSPFTGIAGGSV